MMSISISPLSFLYPSFRSKLPSCIVCSRFCFVQTTITHCIQPFLFRSNCHPALSAAVSVSFKLPSRIVYSRFCFVQTAILHCLLLFLFRSNCLPASSAPVSVSFKLPPCIVCSCFCFVQTASLHRLQPFFPALTAVYNANILTGLSMRLCA